MHIHTRTGSRERDGPWWGTDLDGRLRTGCWDRSGSLVRYWLRWKTEGQVAGTGVGPWWGTDLDGRLRTGCWDRSGSLVRYWLRWKTEGQVAGTGVGPWWGTDLDGRLKDRLLGKRSEKREMGSHQAGLSKFIRVGFSPAFPLPSSVEWPPSLHWRLCTFRVVQQKKNNSYKVAQQKKKKKTLTNKH